jgi:ATP-dependent Lon protease
LSQKDVKIESPSSRDLYRIGTIARVLKLLKMPDGSTTAILQGRKRFQLEDMLSEDPYMLGQISTLEYEQPKNKLEFRALLSSIRDAAKQIIELSPQIPSEAVVMLKNITNDNFLLNFIASNLNIKIEEKQDILEISHLKEKASRILQHMDAELQLLELKDQIEAKVRNDIEKQQRDYFLSQQLKTIQEELGQNPQEDEIKRPDRTRHQEKMAEKRARNLPARNQQTAPRKPPDRRIRHRAQLTWRPCSTCPGWSLPKTISTSGG